MFLDVTLEPRKEEHQIEIQNKKYDWSYENNINSSRVLIDLDRTQEFKYNQWRTNLSLSNHSDTIDAAQKMNQNCHLSDKLHYHFLFNKVRKQKRYGKKKTEEEKKLEKQIENEAKIISLIQDYYKYNIVRAKETYKILTKDQIELIRKKQEKGGAK
jgi:hypothetical protein